MSPTLGRKRGGQSKSAGLCDARLFARPPGPATGRPRKSLGRRNSNWFNELAHIFHRLAVVLARPLVAARLTSPVVRA